MFVTEPLIFAGPLAPSAPLYIWSDMFDPYHNAIDDYYFVEGSIAGSWAGVPSKVTVMNWNLSNLKNSLTWFSGLNSQQPTAYRQIIAGYYDSGVYQGEEYNGENGYGSSDQSADSNVTAAQERLAREGYYNGTIDGVLGSETRRAIARYQSSHGLRATGALTPDTLQALGLQRVANY